MVTTPGVARPEGRRKSVLELASLELDCMNTLWPMGEATVRDIRDALAPLRPRAYTTIMTIMDRLARKGVVTRRKLGRAYLYRPNFSAEQARAHALGQLVAHYFDGSSEALQTHLAGGVVPPPRPAVADSPRPEEPVAADRPRTRRAKPVPAAELSPAPRLDESLL